MILNALFAAVLPVVVPLRCCQGGGINLTRTMAAGPFNIRVNAYLPGVIVTDDRGGPAGTGEEMLNQLALHRFGCGEMAEPLVFLASRAARYHRYHIGSEWRQICRTNPGASLEIKLLASRLAGPDGISYYFGARPNSMSLTVQGGAGLLLFAKEVSC